MTYFAVQTIIMFSSETVFWWRAAAGMAGCLLGRLMKAVAAGVAGRQ